MNKRLTKFISILLIASMAFSMASCSKIESFFDLDHGNKKKHSRDKDDDEHREFRADRNNDDEDDVDEDYEDEDDDIDDVIDVDIVDGVVTGENGLTYPDHIPTVEELHPYHAPGNISGQAASDLLDELELEYLQRAIGGSYVNAAILFDDPSVYGITIDNISWGEAIEDRDEAISYLSETLDTLYTIDYESLDFQDRAFYDKFVYDFEVSLYVSSYTAFDYYSMAFDPLIGPQCEVLFILDVLEITTVEEAENYILVLEDLDRYYDEICEFEEERAEYGYASTSEVYMDVAASFDALVAQADDCFLYESFAAKVNAIPGIAPELAADIIARHDQVMHEVVFPEFEECSERMEALAVYDGAQQGVGAFAGGDAYYTVLFMEYANSTKSIEETTTQLEAMIDALYSNLMLIAMGSDRSWFDEYMDHNYSMGDTDANLAYLEEAIRPDFPDLPEHDYYLRDVPESLQENFSPAAYLGFHLDRFDSNLIITNQSQVTDTFGVTCAHEGYPGHMFQSVYTRSHCEHPYLYLNDSIGFTEGWATYVENYSFRYFVDNETAGTAIQIEEEFNVLLFARLDIGINYEGWDIQDCLDYYASVFGSSDGVDFTRMYQIVTNQPGYGVKYGIGFINTGLVMTQAHHDFPDATDEEIHTAYLNALPLTFEMIYERMQVELSGN